MNILGHEFTLRMENNMVNEKQHEFEIIDGYFDGKTTIRKCIRCLYTYEHVGDDIFTGKKGKIYNLPDCIIRKEK